MKLVIVDRARSMTYERMRYLFAGDPTVAVIWDRRKPDERRQRPEQRAPERRIGDRRQKAADFGGRGFIVVDTEAPPLKARSAEASRYERYSRYDR